MSAARVPRVLIWTEAHWVGGCDRFLADLLRGLEGRPWAWRLAGIPLDEYDAWYAAQLPEARPRVTRRMASLPGSPLTRLRPAGEDGPQPEVSAADTPVPTALKAAVAGLRYRHAATNLVRLRRLLRGARPDVLFVNNGGYPGGESCRYACLAARAERVPRVVHFVHNMAYEPNWPPAAERAIDRRVDAAVDAWVTAAHRASDRLAAGRDVDAAKVHTVHYGVPDAPRPAPADRVGLGFADGALNLAVVAAFEPRKGHGVLLEALSAVDADVRVAFVGRGPEEDRMRQRAAELGLAERVRFLGWRDDVDAILEAADALVLPSLSNECLPYAILEAMAHGLPVVGTDVAGIPEEIADGVTGFVVAPGDAPALVRAIGALAADPGARARMGTAALERVRSEFPLERMVDGVTALWG